MGNTGVANHLCTSAGQSRRYVLTIIDILCSRKASLASPVLLHIFISSTKCLECNSQTITYLELVATVLVHWNWTVYSGRRIGFNSLFLASQYTIYRALETLETVISFQTKHNRFISRRHQDKTKRVMAGVKLQAAPNFPFISFRLPEFEM